MAIALKTILKGFTTKRFKTKIGELEYNALIDDRAHRMYFDTDDNELYKSIPECSPINISMFGGERESYTVDRKVVNDYKKENKDKPYIFEYNGLNYGINTKYLLETIDFIGNGNLYIVNPKTPILMWSDDWQRLAIICPVVVIKK